MSERKFDYKTYIRSQAWYALKDRKRAEAGDHCNICFEEDVPLELDHLHYKTVGHEELSDVQLLCSTCHRKITKWRSWIKRANAWSRKVHGTEITHDDCKRIGRRMFHFMKWLGSKKDSDWLIGLDDIFPDRRNGSLIWRSPFEISHLASQGVRQAEFLKYACSELSKMLADGIETGSAVRILTEEYNRDVSGPNFSEVRSWIDHFKSIRCPA